MAIDQCLRQAGIGTAQTHAIIFVEPAFATRGRADIDARQALQRIGNIFVGHLAHILCADHFLDRIGILF